MYFTNLCKYNDVFGVYGSIGDPVFLGERVWCVYYKLLCVLSYKNKFPVKNYELILDIIGKCGKLSVTY